MPAHWAGPNPASSRRRVQSLLEVWSHGMPNKVIPFPSGNTAKPETIFVRERLILNVASLRYEMELIGIFTPLPPKRVRQPKRPAVSTAERKLLQPAPDDSNRVSPRRSERPPEAHHERKTCEQLTRYSNAGRT